MEDNILAENSKSQSGCAFKMLALLILISALVGGGIYWGIQIFNARKSNNLPPLQPVEQQPPVASQLDTSTSTIIDPPALVLAKQLMAADNVSRKGFIVQINSAEGSKVEAIDFLTTSLAQSTTDVKSDIVGALGLLAKTNPEAVPGLVGALDDKTIRNEVMATLASLGKQGMPAVPKLKAISQNKKESKSVRFAAKKALAEIQGTTKKKVPSSKTKSRGHHKKKK